MERSGQALVEALGQALAGPGEQRLYRSGKLEGLFPRASGPQREAAARALREGLLEVVRTETRGKTEIDWVRITPRGVEYLHEHESPVSALRDLQSVLHGSREAVPVWLTEMRAQLQALDSRLAQDAQRWEQRLAALEKRVEEALRRLEAAGPLLPPELARDHPWAIDALNYLDWRRLGGNGQTPPCPLPELFSAVAQHHPSLSIPSFHDGLRKLHQHRALRLEPAAADLGSLPQAEYALLSMSDETGPIVLYLARR
jgi:hypothetical protein